MEGAHEIAFVTPFAAALTARMLPTSAGSRARAVVAGALVLTGYTAGLGYEISQPYQPAAHSQLASWLCAHHLDYGLSGYWQSSVVTVDSAGCAQVRALSSGLKQDLWMVDEAWYDPGSHDARAGPQAAWPPGLISRVFGKPAHVYHVGPYTVMVWNHNLLYADR